MQIRSRTIVLAVCMLTAACDSLDRSPALTGPRPAPGAPTATVGVPTPIGYAGYTLTDISAGLESRALDINSHGWVVGTHTVSGSEHGFVRHADGTIEDVPPLPGDVSNVVTGISNMNEIAGTSTAPNGDTHAWRRIAGLAMDRLSDSICNRSAHANAIDDDGEIAGGCAGVPFVWHVRPRSGWWQGVEHGDLYDIAAFTPVGTIQVFEQNTGAVAFPTSGKTILDMPAGTTDARVNSINVSPGSTLMAGGYTVGVGGVERGFWATFGATHLLSHVVYGINAAGRMVGWYPSIPAVAYTIAPNGFGETPLPPTNVDRTAVRVNYCGTIVGAYFPSGRLGGARAAMWTKQSCD